MKANELMIGDWVREKGSKLPPLRYTGEILHFKPIKGEPYIRLRCMWNKTEGLDIPETYIEPIPLTEEILEKNGIKLEEVGDNGISTPPKWRNRFEKWVLRTQWKDTFIWYDRTAKYWHLHDMGAAKLLYVHELQHALRLCGIEKEIVL